MSIRNLATFGRSPSCRALGSLATRIDQRLIPPFFRAPFHVKVLFSETQNPENERVLAAGKSVHT